MARIIVPIENHKNGLHMGHEALIDYAKTFPGTLVVSILGNAFGWRQHLLTGSPFTAELISPKMNQDIIRRGGLVREAALMPVYESWRIPAYNKASALVSLYKEALILDEYVRRAISILMGMMVFRHSTISKSDIMVRGPELISFFHKSVSALTQGPEIHIMPTIIKNPETKIREQGAINLIDEEFKPYINRLHYVIAGARDKYKIGKNDDLVQELNDAYARRPWKVKDIVVYEGGLVPGRMEVTQFTMPSVSGIVVIEDVEFESN